MYGARETNPITDQVREIRDLIDHQNPVDLTDPRLARITRLRLVSDPGFPMWDLSYCYGQLADGTHVRVDLPWYQLRKRALSADLVEMCKSVGVYGKRLGILDAVSTLT